MGVYMTEVRGEPQALMHVSVAWTHGKRYQQVWWDRLNPPTIRIGHCMGAGADFRMHVTKLQS
ncbi:MAG: hypothetical protein HOO98_11530 [Nitrospira sp.]|nr:hypothetical protein [Nitrospira sp.]